MSAAVVEIEAVARSPSGGMADISQALAMLRLSFLPITGRRVPVVLSTSD